VGISLKKRFAGIEPMVVKMVRENGIQGAMTLLGVRTYNTFVKYLRDNTDVDEWHKDILHGMRGGFNRQFILKHRLTILDCWHIFGKEWTESHFCLTHDTLEGLLHVDEKPTNELSRLDKLEMEVRLIKDFEARLLQVESSVSYLWNLVADNSKVINSDRRALQDGMSAMPVKMAEAFGQLIFGVPLNQSMTEAMNDIKSMLPQVPSLKIDTLLPQETETKEHGVDPELRRTYLLSHPLARDNDNHSKGDG